MKIIRIMLAMVILLSVNSLSAFAQENATTSFAYISLLPANPVVSSDQESFMPIEMLSQQAYNRLLPDLLKAQRQGVIVQFRPEFSAGMVKVEYTTGTAMASQLGDGFSIFSDPTPILQNLRAFTRKPAGSSDAPAVLTPNFILHPKGSLILGSNFPADRYLKFTLTDPSGKLMAVASAYTQSDGHIWAYFSWGSWTTMESGYKFTAKMYLLDRTTLVRTFYRIIPNLGITSIDIASKTVKGTAPANSSIRVQLTHFNLNAANDNNTEYLYPIASGTGQWQTTFTIAMRGNDYMEIGYSPNANFIFVTSMEVPYIYAGLDTNFGVLSGIPNTPASMTIRHAGVDHSFSGKFGNWGEFYAELLDAGGAPIFLQAGDKITGTGVTALTIPTMTASIDAATDILSGTAPASRFLIVYLNVRKDCGGYSCWYGYGRYLKSTLAGTYSANFSSDADILPNETVVLEVDFIAPATGNEVFYRNPVSP